MREREREREREIDRGGRGGREEGKHRDTFSDREKLRNTRRAI
jgi:hypothetical protein